MTVLKCYSPITIALYNFTQYKNGICHCDYYTDKFISNEYMNIHEVTYYNSEAYVKKNIYILIKYNAKYT